jgi:hypothetical protein
MTTLDTVLHVIEHAKRHQLDGRLVHFLAAPSRLAMTVPDLDAFLGWGRTLDEPFFTGHLDAVFDGVHDGLLDGKAEITVTGRLRSGHQFMVTVPVDREQLRAADLVGALVYGQIEQFARKQVAA